MITSVYIDTDELVFQLHSVSDDAQKALEWVRAFRDTLMFGARIPNPLPFAMECMAMSEGFSASGVLGKLRAAARKRLNDEGIEATPESIDAEIARTQGADAVRDIMAKIERANSLKAEIRRRKFTAAATTREGVDVVTTSESCRSKRTTGCNPLTADGDTREDSLNIATSSNGRVTESGTSANHYDQEANPAGAGANLDSTQTIKRPDASSGNAEGVILTGSTITRNGSRAACTSATSGQTIEKADAPTRKDGEDKKSRPSANNSGEGSTPGIERTSASLPAPTPSKPEKESFGEFGNVKLTSDEYSKLLTRVDNAQALIEELDQYIESQGKSKKYKSHYATLLNWSRRKATEAKQPSRYKNINDINRENCEQIERDLRAMFHPEEVI